MMRIQKICLFFPHGIGDVVNATPIVLGLKAKWPEALITIVTRSKIEYELFGGPTEIDGYIIFDIHKKQTFGSITSFFKTLKRQRFDMIIGDNGIDRIKTPIFFFLLGIKYRVGESNSFFSFLYTHKSIPNHSIHKVYNNNNILKCIGIESNFTPYVFYDESDKEKVLSVMDKYGLSPTDNIIIMHPGSGAWESHKRWPKEKYVSLIKILREKNNDPVIVVGGKDEHELCAFITNGFHDDNVYNFSGVLEIRELAALLSISKIVIGADSGVMHIASAVGAKTISIFGPTPYYFTSPFKNNIVITKSLPCSPCYDRMQFGCGKPQCMSSISEWEIFSELQKNM